MPAWDSFIGPSYLSRSTWFDGEISRNLYLENAASGTTPKTGKFLIKTPGLKLFAALPQAPVRGMFVGDLFDNKFFAAGGARFYQVNLNPDGTFNTAVDLGNIGLDAGPVEAYNNLPSNATQTMIVSAGQAYIIGTGAGGAFPAPTLISSFVSGFPGVSHGAFMDGFFIAQAIAKPDGTFANQFFISSPLDGTVWDLTQFATKMGATDRLVRIFVDHDILWLFGELTTEVWYNAGAAPFPLVKYPGATIECGLYAHNSVAKLDNSLFWLGSSDRGHGIVYRGQGFTPIRVSNHAVETAIQSYADAPAATGYSYQEEGHHFYRLDFAKNTWLYDTATNSWHERAAWDPANAVWLPHWAKTHCFLQGKHFVGDYRNGNIYLQSLNYLDDAGTLIRWLRSSPHLSAEMKWQFYNDLWVDMAVGQGLASGQGQNPQVMMRLSNDGGQTWGNEHWANVGKIGQFKYRARWRRLGRARDRCFEVSGSDPINVMLLDAYLETAASDGI